MASAELELQKARAFIKAGDYSEARAILIAVDHPTAQDWLMKIDERMSDKPKRSDDPFAAAPTTGGSSMIVNNINQAAAPMPTTQVVVNQGGSANWLVQGVWFLFLGWWLGVLWITFAWAFMTTIIGIPLAIWMINRVSGVMALRSPSKKTVITVNGYNTTVEVNAQTEQYNFFLRAAFFVFFGWWLSAIWMYLAYFFCLLIIGLPLGFWMFDKTPFVLTLQR